MRFLCSAYRYLPAYLPSYPSFSLIIFYFAPPLHPLYRFLSITISVPSLFCLYRSCCFSYTNSLHPSPSLLHYLYCCVVSLLPFTLSTSRFSIVLSLSLYLAGSLLVALTARNQYIPFHTKLPYHVLPPRPSTLDRGPPTPRRCYPYYVQSLSLSLLLCLCWYCTFLVAFAARVRFFINQTVLFFSVSFSLMLFPLSLYLFVAYIPLLRNSQKSLPLPLLAPLFFVLFSHVYHHDRVSWFTEGARSP